MLKKWLYIFGFLCLANSQPLVIDLYSHTSSSTLLNLIIGQFQDEDEDEGHGSHKALCRQTFTINRGFAIGIRIPLQTAFGIFRLPGFMRHVYGNHLIRKPILPAYYNFLFRLSPF